MLKYFLFIIVMAPVVFFSCSGQKAGNSDLTIIDGLEHTPFVVKRSSDYLTLSDTDSTDSLHGFSVLELIIDGDGKIADFNIKKMLLANADDTLVSYVNTYRKNLSKEDYEPIIQDVYPALENFVSKLDVQKTEIVPEDTNRMFIMVKFK